ncbi:MAG TPA: TIM barrel protein [Tepidisphaeraceae bacterium]|nr:TIM barrel protein [Tepidisphaeraceae bacterium]
MNYSRRAFGKLALGAIPMAATVASGIMSNPTRLSASDDKPNSLINGVQIGVITFSYLRMPDQSAEATLGYVVQSGISAIELMDGPLWDFARQRTGFTPPNAGGRGGQFGRGGVGGAGRGPAGGGEFGNSTIAEQVAKGSWHGQPCATGAPLLGPGGAAVGRGRGRGQRRPEQIAAAQAAAEETRKWQQSVSMNVFKDLRAMYNAAGVSIYAVKILDINASDEELDRQFTIGKTLGANHLTAELPDHSDTSTALLKKVGDAALRNGMSAAYHTHLQGSIDCFAEAFAASEGNKSNIDFGHYVAAGEIGGTPMDFLNKYHDRTASFHIKDRTLPQHCALQVPFGEGDVPIKGILQLVEKNKWPIPATIELSYPIPDDSNDVKEVQKSLAYCRSALT